MDGIFHTESQDWTSSLRTTFEVLFSELLKQFPTASHGAPAGAVPRTYSQLIFGIHHCSRNQHTILVQF